MVVEVLDSQLIAPLIQWLDQYPSPAYLVRAHGGIEWGNRTGYRYARESLIDAIYAIGGNADAAVIDALADTLTHTNRAPPHRPLLVGSDGATICNVELHIIGNGASPLRLIIFHLTDNMLLDAHDRIRRTYDLSNSEMAVLSRFMLGYTQREIAVLRGRSLQTVKRQTVAIYKKFGVNTREAMLAVAFGMRSASTLAPLHDGRDCRVAEA